MEMIFIILLFVYVIVGKICDIMFDKYKKDKSCQRESEE